MNARNAMLHIPRPLPYLFGSALAAIAFAASAHPAAAANLYFTPPADHYRPGETGIFELRIDNQGECINAADITVSYPSDRLEAVDVSRGDSIFTVWVTPPTIHQDLGRINLVGGIPGGYCGRTPGDPAITNVLATFVFRFREEGYTKPATVKVGVLDQESQVDLHDGAGTRAPLTSTPTEITIDAASPPHENAWTQAITDDKTPPEPFSVTVLRESSVFDNHYFAVFSAVDKQTGIARYEMLETKDRNAPESQSGWRRVESPAELQDQALSSTVFVRAIDKAGNARIAEYTPAESAPQSWWERLALWIVASLAITFLALYKVLSFLPRLF
jgi:hypothetical protein